MVKVINGRSYDVSRSGADVVFAPVGAAWTIEVCPDGRVFMVTPVRADADTAHGPEFRGWLAQECRGADVADFLLAVRNLRGV